MAPDPAVIGSSGGGARSRGDSGEVVGAGRPRRQKLCSGSFRRCLAPPEIGTRLSVGFGLTDKPRFVCPLIKALAIGAHCPVTCGTPPIRTFS
jgi:hypothetical protein